MAIYRVQVSFPRNTSLPEDVATNTWHFVRNAMVENTFISNVNAALREFYFAISDSFGNNVRLALAELRWYNLADPEPRTPVFTGPFGTALTNPTGDPLPSEVAVCFSMAAAGASGAPAARRRGRVFLGPLNRAIQSSSDRDRIDLTHITTMTGAAHDHLIGITGLAFDEGLAVYSRKDLAAHLVTHGWVDNAFDTQRRRGKRATSRDVWS